MGEHGSVSGHPLKPWGRPALAQAPAGGWRGPHPKDLLCS